MLTDQSEDYELRLICLACLAICAGLELEEQERAQGLRLCAMAGCSQAEAGAYMRAEGRAN